MLAKSPIIRVFFGIPISEDDAQEFRKILLKENPQLKNQVRWTRPGNHHVTVRFLGNIAEQKVPLLIDAVANTISDTQPFTLKLWNIAPFPAMHGRMGSANIQPSAELQSLYDAVDLVVSVDFPPENRAYMPHITLFRLSNKQHIDFEKIPLGDRTLDVKELILYQSVQIEKGSLYVPLHKFPF